MVAFHFRWALLEQRSAGMSTSLSWLTTEGGVHRRKTASVIQLIGVVIVSRSHLRTRSPVL